MKSIHNEHKYSNDSLVKLILYSFKFTITANIGSLVCSEKQSQRKINVGFRLDIPNFTADELCKLGGKFKLSGAISSSIKWGSHFLNGMDIVRISGLHGKATVTWCVSHNPYSS